MTPLRRSGFTEGFQAILEHIRGLIYIFILIIWFQSCWDTISPCMYWRLPFWWWHHPSQVLSCSNTYWRQTGQKPLELYPPLWMECCRQREKVSHEQEPLRGSNTFHKKDFKPQFRVMLCNNLSCVCVCVVLEAYFQLGGSTCGSGWGAGKAGMGGGRYPPTTPIKMSAILKNMIISLF